MSDNVTRADSGRGRAIAGALLVVLGIVFLLDQVYPIDLGRQGWPLFVIVPGLFICTFAVAMRGAAGEGLFIFGTITTVVGLILAYQNYTDHWESWAYAWALAFPGAIGLGQVVYGTLTGRGASVRAGTRVGLVGLVLFVGFAAFFELAIGISGRQIAWLSGYIVPALLIGLGVLMLLGNTRVRRQAPVIAPAPAPQPPMNATEPDVRQVGAENKGLE